MSWKKIFSSKIFFALLLLLVLFFISTLWNRWQEKKSLEIRWATLSNKATNLEKENVDLEKEKNALTGADSAERVLRQIYVLKKPGEEALVIPEELLKEEGTMNNEKNIGFWKKIMNWF